MKFIRENKEEKKIWKWRRIKKEKILNQNSRKENSNLINCERKGFLESQIRVRKIQNKYPKLNCYIIFLSVMQLKEKQKLFKVQFVDT